MPVISARQSAAVAKFSSSLRDFLRLIGMLGGDAVEPGDKFVHARLYFIVQDPSGYIPNRLRNST